MSIEQPSRAYGLSTNLFVHRRSGGESIVVGGTAEDQSRWTRVLSQRAAQMLWFYLTQLLYPEKSDLVTALVTTAPLRSADLPTVTTHTTADKKEDGSYQIMGWVGDQTWMVRLGDQETQRFWTALDIALYPAGWQGAGAASKNKHQ